jgi:serine/threonine protein kinase
LSFLIFSYRLGVGELGGEVSEGRWNDKLIAVKTLRIGVHPEKFSATDKTYLENEIGILSRLRHKNLTAIIGICFDIDIYPRILLSFAEHGTIIDFIRRFPTKVDWSLRLSWCTNTSDALTYLHQSNIFHRNLKSSNILIGVDLRAHVCDYGLIPIVQTLRQACDSERCLCKLTHPALPLSIRWSSPEILSNPSDNSNFNYASDVYSFGVCLWEQIRLEQPYAEIKDEAEVSRMIIDGQYLTLFEETTTTIMPEYQQLMNDCWLKNPNDRPKFEHISQILREATPKVKQFQKMSIKRHSSQTNSPDLQDEHSILFRLDSVISTDASKSPHPNA